MLLRRAWQTRPPTPPGLYKARVTRALLVIVLAASAWAVLGNFPAKFALLDGRQSAASGLLLCLVYQVSLSLSLHVYLICVCVYYISAASGLLLCLVFQVAVFFACGSLTARIFVYVSIYN